MTVNFEKLFSTFFNEAADAAGIIALKYFRQNIAVDEKSDRSPVTQADREIELKLRGMIAHAFPDHGIWGEEFGQEKIDAEFVWVIDPIDGTRSFTTGRPLFGCILGLLYQGKPMVGLIDQPYTKERWFGVTDTFATFNGAPIHVAPPRSWPEVRLYTGSIDMFKGENFEKYLELCRTARWTQYACDCYAYGLLAMGCIDLWVEQSLKIYDIAGAVPILTGAGGYVSDWKGRPIDLNFDGYGVGASSKALAMKAIEIFTS